MIRTLITWRRDYLQEAKAYSFLHPAFEALLKRGGYYQEREGYVEPTCRVKPDLPNTLANPVQIAWV